MTLIWMADFSSKNDSNQAGFGTVERQVDKGPIVKSSIAIPAAVSTTLGNALKLELNEAETRLESAPKDNKGGGLTEGVRRYFRLDFALDADFVLPPRDWVLINQIHQGETQSSPPIEFVIVGDNLKVRGNYKGTYRTYEHDLGRLLRETRYVLTFQVTFSETASKCQLNCWVNGHRKVLNFVPPTPNVYGGPSYWKGASLYCGPAAATKAPLVVYQTNHRVGTSLVDVSGPT